jgi:hypothetical protein
MELDKLIKFITAFVTGRDSGSYKGNSSKAKDNTDKAA